MTEGPDQARIRELEALLRLARDVINDCMHDWPSTRSAMLQKIDAALPAERTDAPAA